jgi:uncharacterized phage-associated protein
MPAPTTPSLGAPAAAASVARYLVLLAHAEEDGPAQEPDFLTHMRLQKLLYFVQGWALGMTGAPMFNDRIEAWRFGPVVPNVYQVFKKYGAGPISEKEGNFEGLTDKQKAFIRRCWETYKQYGPISLVELSHKEKPWKTARGNVSATANTSDEITVDSMRRSFAARATNG